MRHHHPKRTAHDQLQTALYAAQHPIREDPPSKKRLVVICTLVILIVIAIVVYVEFFAPPRTPTGPNIKNIITKELNLRTIEHAKKLKGKKTNEKWPRQIWAYWEGSTPPAYEQRCIQSWRAWLPGYEIRIVNGYEELKLLVPAEDLPDCFESIPKPQIKADIARVALLKNYGGVWHDMSILLTRDYQWLEDIMDSGREFTGYAMQHYSTRRRLEPKQVIENWWFAARANTPIITAWHRVFLDALRSCNCTLDYSKTIYRTKPVRHSIKGSDYLFQAYQMLWLRRNDKAVRKAFAENRAFIMVAEAEPFFKFLSKEEWMKDYRGPLPRFMKLVSGTQELRDLVVNGTPQKPSSYAHQIHLATKGPA